MQIKQPIPSIVISAILKWETKFVITGPYEECEAKQCIHSETFFKGYGKKYNLTIR